MGLSSARRVVITGAPGSGKSTLLDALATRGWNVVEEAARAILQRQRGMELRAGDPLGFALAMLSKGQAAFFGSDPHTSTIFDRGLADIATFLRIENQDVPLEIDQACRQLRFDGPVFYAPAWKEIYRQDSERIQNWEEAVESCRQNHAAWCDYGYNPIILPLTNVDQRVRFVEYHIAKQQTGGG